MISISQSSAVKPPAITRIRAEAVFDRVSEDSVDSFPASDPPSWSPLQVGPPAHDTPHGQKDP
jgi:hypothetical protein